MSTSSAEQKRAKVSELVQQTVRITPAEDIHTHLYDPAFGRLLLWGIDDLLVYHYLVAEAFRYSDLPYSTFWSLSKTEQAELIWNHLFIEHSPISEACRGVLTTLHWLGLDIRKRDLNALRQWFAQQDPVGHIGNCMNLAGLKSVSMTNSPFDPEEREVWVKGFNRDPRFTSALRIDPLLLDWPHAASELAQAGYHVTQTLTAKCQGQVRRFLDHWTDRMQARYLMVSLPPEWRYPDESDCTKILDQVLLPHCRERHLPLALMPGVRRGVNPALQLAGDGVGQSDLQSLARLCAMNPDNKFMATVLSRENQHELCVLARKFRSLHIFGCWWFLNNPHLIEEITRMRLELLGLAFTPQHSDARVLDQVIYKWQHTRTLLARVLTDKYLDLLDTGWEVSKADVQRDVTQLLGAGFDSWRTARS